MPSDDWRLCREAVERFMAGESNNAICRWLGGRGGIRSRNGFLQWLKHPALRGHSKHRDELIYNTHEPLITEQEWQTIQQRLTQNRELRGANAGRVYAVPNGLCRCDHCGRSLASKVSTHGRYFYCYYRCSLRDGSCDGPRKYCRDEWVEAAIQNEIQARADEVADRHLQPDSAPDPRLAAKEAELAQLQKLAHVAGVAEAIAGLELEIAQIKTASESEAVGDAEREERIIALAALLPEDWAQLSNEERRAIYGALVSVVRVSGAEVVEVVLR